MNPRHECWLDACTNLVIIVKGEAFYHFSIVFKRKRMVALEFQWRNIGDTVLEQSTIDFDRHNLESVIYLLTCIYSSRSMRRKANGSSGLVSGWSRSLPFGWRPQKVEGRFHSRVSESPSNDLRFFFCSFFFLLSILVWLNARLPSESECYGRIINLASQFPTRGSIQNNVYRYLDMHHGFFCS